VVGRKQLNGNYIRGRTVNGNFPKQLTVSWSGAMYDQFREVRGSDGFAHKLGSTDGKKNLQTD